MAIPNHYTEKLFEALKECARKMRTESYDNLAQEIGMKKGGGHALRLHLKHIRDKICIERGLPHLNQLAVNATKWLPGESVLPDEFKIPNDAKKLLWRGMVLQVFAHRWDGVKFKADS